MSFHSPSPPSSYLFKFWFIDSELLIQLIIVVSRGGQDHILLKTFYLFRGVRTNFIYLGELY